MSQQYARLKPLSREYAAHYTVTGGWATLRKMMREPCKVVQPPVPIDNAENMVFLLDPDLEDGLPYAFHKDDVIFLEE